ncbi:ornithine carbamoyltransferase [Pholiota conissans]|uniref:ornithine carbamoyltransferase n=1 Tax=Pholiota conissans TaxID=109636 RepID=A0A9P5YYB5_9AGAR|nr:ornithine carbamoyltransferase [Pholiota conissans]
MAVPRHLMTLADLSPAQINRVLAHSLQLKHRTKPWLLHQKPKKLQLPPQSLFLKTIALLFSKRSTRTRIAAETSASILGGQSLFLGSDDIQLGVNESLRDSAQVIGSMCQGFFARVGDHSEIEELAKYSPVPVLNALSSLWHPTQVLADLLTLHETAALKSSWLLPPPEDAPKKKTTAATLLPLKPLTIAYVGDSANVLHDMLVTYPRLGHSMRVASPAAYRAPTEVWDRLKVLGIDKDIFWSEDPTEAVRDADVVVTDTWISMGQEAEKAERLKAFQGYQVTEALCANAKPDWMFLHCLPRKPDEVDDEVFYGPRSLVFPEAENRKWTIMALFDLMFGKGELFDEPKGKRND